MVGCWWDASRSPAGRQRAAWGDLDALETVVGDANAVGRCHGETSPVGVVKSVYHWPREVPHRWDGCERLTITRFHATARTNRTLRYQFNRVCRHETRVIVEKSGIPVAAIVSAEDLERLRWLDEEDREAGE